MVGVNQGICVFAENVLKNFLMKNRFREQDPIKKRVTLPISHKMVVGRVWDGYLKKMVFIAEVIQKIGSPTVGEAGVKIASEVYWGSRICFSKFSNSDR